MSVGGIALLLGTGEPLFCWGCPTSAGAAEAPHLCWGRPRPHCCWTSPTFAPGAPLVLGASLFYASLPWQGAPFCCGAPFCWGGPLRGALLFFWGRSSSAVGAPLLLDESNFCLRCPIYIGVPLFHLKHPSSGGAPPFCWGALLCWAPLFW